MNNVKYTTRHIPKKHKWYKVLIIILILLGIIAIIAYPHEIGQFIGDWVSEFKNGYNN